MFKRVLITGGAGFIGSNMALKLINQGYVVTVLDNLSEQIHGTNAEKTSPLFNSIKNKVTFIKGSVTDRRVWEQALVDQDAVIHLAAETGTGQSMYDIQKYIDVNIGGTGILLDILANKEYVVKKIVVASSRAIYGEGKYECLTHGFVYPKERSESDLSKGEFECKCNICNQNLILHATSEDSLIHPTSIYGITKQTQEQMVLVAGKALGIPAVAFRYQNVYGPGQSLKNPYTGILSIFSTQIKNGNPINIFEDGKESRDFIYIDDIVDATILGLEKEIANYEVFNVGYGEATDVITIAKKLRDSYNSSIDINISGNYRIGDIRHNYADMSKTEKLLGFQAKWDFSKGVDEFCKWVNTQEVASDKFSESITELKEKGLFK
ncbi:NAD-dependent epimerase/dehydratase family protein [Flavobacteriaceae bacterium]|nr:NAD-dependent epimerase/dehydratase family protein [Flavobacteriaceae bacterium]